MRKTYSLLEKVNGCFIHGADYNPDQWLHRPDIIKKDVELMKKANCNTVSLGIFSWSILEPEEGEYDFKWLDWIMGLMEENNINVILATPSGAKPAWMAQKYPEVLRVQSDRMRILYGNRHNHCYTSPVYRKKVREINKRLAARYHDHPALVLWHVSNEYGGECHCELCQKEFRRWLKAKYQTLDVLNQAWWTGFWSHRYTDWSQIESPAPHGEQSNHGLSLDWKRFVTAQTLDFYCHEVKALRENSDTTPVTTNFMGTYPGLDYSKFSKYLDIVAVDSYPEWHGQRDDWKVAADTGFVMDLYRSFKDRPFLLMESTPSLVNWREVSKRKRPGMHLLSSLQAVAHGSDSVQYFQWRKGRGGQEKFHGAVVDHCGREDTRVFKEVTEVGKLLKVLEPIMGTGVKAEVGLIFDWENRWGIEETEGPRKDMKYEETCKYHYRSFWKKGIPVDIIDQERDFSRYKILLVPMLYMLKKGTVERLKSFVKEGGTLISTYWTGIVNESDLCFLDGFPGKLIDLFGIRVEETDALYDGERNCFSIGEDCKLDFNGKYQSKEIIDLLSVESAEVIATYDSDYYKNYPAVTLNYFGQGEAYYIASRSSDEFLDDFYTVIINKNKVRKAVEAELPEGVTAQLRVSEEREYIFLMNFTDQWRSVFLGKEELVDLISEKPSEKELNLKPYDLRILVKDVAKK